MRRLLLLTLILLWILFAVTAGQKLTSKVHDILPNTLETSPAITTGQPVKKLPEPIQGLFPHLPA